ncbi:MAG: TonB-dependent receptor [Tannerellaceae bacterium]|nr:TonB-dependent receptor [Tannerellaceae bacterium]
MKGYLQNVAGFAFRQEGNIQRWQAEGRFDPANPIRYPAYPRLEDLSNQTTPNIEMSDFWILNASYLRVKNIVLGYTLPQKITRKALLGHVRLYVQAENPLTFNQYRKGWDPEISTGGKYYPILSTYTFGINLKF